VPRITGTMLLQLRIVVPQTLSLLSALLPTACRHAFRIYHIALLGREFCGFKSPPSSTHVLMKTGYLRARFFRFYI
jgi:hypothetical protein